MMGDENPKERKNEAEPLAQPSEGPAKIEPTPERAREEKEKQRQQQKACPPDA